VSDDRYRILREAFLGDIKPPKRSLWDVRDLFAPDQTRYRRIPAQPQRTVSAAPTKGASQRPVVQPSSLENALRVVGEMAPGTGEAFAVKDALKAAKQGNWKRAGIAAASAIPLFGKAKKAGDVAETLAGVAIRTPDGKVLSKFGFDGGHESLVPMGAVEYRAFDRGFVTTTGRYVDRAEGLALAREAQMLRKKVEDEKLHASDLHDIVKPKKPTGQAKGMSVDDLYRELSDSREGRP
jgi:hypothetical protein